PVLLDPGHHFHAVVVRNAALLRARGILRAGRRRRGRMVGPRGRLPGRAASDAAAAAEQPTAPRLPCRRGGARLCSPALERRGGTPVFWGGSADPPPRQRREKTGD